MTDDVFEISDFTTVSDWETFVSDLEEVITRWQLSGLDSGGPLTAEDVSRGVWTQKQENIRFSKTTFSLVFHKLRENEEKREERTEEPISCQLAALDGQRVAMDWPARAHCAVRYFGIRSFLVLFAENVDNEDRLRLVLSSATMALNATQCSLPLLVEWSRARRLFSGVSLNSSQRIDFQTIQTKSSRFKHLSSLLEVFRKEIGIHAPTIQVSIRMTFVLKRFPAFVAHQNRENRLPDFEDEDPVLELQMAAIWPSLAEDAIIDSENHSDLDPNCAQNLTLRPVFRETQKSSFSASLDLLLTLLEEKKVILNSLEEKEFKDVFIHLTDARQNWIRNQIKDHVFAPQEESREGYSAPVGSLVWRLALSVCHVFGKERKLEDLRLLWRQFVSEVRASVDKNRVLPNCWGIPDLNFGLLYQKLQMINTCIVENEEEFFDAEEFIEGEEGSLRAEGRLKESQLKRVNQPDQMIWIPETQEAPPMTQDMVSDQLAVLQRLGTSQASAGLRARLQSAVLLSDMEAFKAANLGACFEDFVRWHSPRDCDSNGLLSPRFKTSDNFWLELWRNARPVAVRRQKRLFDATTEAEKAIHFLSSLSFSDLAELVIPVIIDCCLLQLKEQNPSFDARHVRNQLSQKNFKTVIALIRAQQMLQKRIDSLEQKLNDKSIVEKLVTQPEIQMTTQTAERMRQLFLRSQELEREKTSIGERDARPLSPFPPPTAKEFVLRAWSSKPSLFSRSVPQRMYCLWSEEEVRLASAFSQDLTYF